MKITDKINGYADMTAEEKLAALEGLDIEESKGNDDSEIQKLKDALNKASSDTASYKKQLREKQTEQERLEAEKKEELQKKDELLNQLLKEKNVSKYQSEFLKNGFDSELAEKSAVALADGDLDSVFANLSKFTTGLKKSVEAELLKKTPAPGGANNGADLTITKEQFEKMGYAEMVEFKNNNPELYNSFKQS